MGAGFESAGERCMTCPLPYPSIKKTADALVDRLVKQAINLKVGPQLHRSTCAAGPSAVRDRWPRILSMLNARHPQ